MALDPELKQKCLDIIDEIFRHPISVVFHDPVDPVADEVSDYFDVVQHPSDLSTVRTKLLNDRYRSLQDFKRDMNLIWDNAVQYNGRQSLPGFIADRLSRIFQKRTAALDDPSPDQWVNDFLKARSVLCKLFRTAPKGFSFASARNASVHELAAPPRTHISSADLDFFKAAESGVLRTEGMRAKLFQIVTEMEPGLDLGGPSFPLDLASLSPRTLTVLKEWIKTLKVDPPG
jgi:hypothetical protein